MKGADVLQKMDMHGAQPFQKQTFKAVQEFASKGLRTLCVAMKVIEEEVFERCRRVKCAVGEGKERRIEELQEQIEEGVLWEPQDWRISCRREYPSGGKSI